MKSLVSSSRSVLGAAALAAMLEGCSSAEPPAESVAESPAGMVRLSDAQCFAAGITTQRVDTGTVRRRVEIPGSVQSPDTSHSVVGSIVEGQVVGVRVLPGDRVARGEPLLEIQSPELAEAERDLATAEAELAFHLSALERSERLFAAGAVSLEEVERRRADAQAAQADLALAVELVDRLSPSPDGNVTARAPRSGTVFAVHARPGQAVLPGTPLLEMGSTDVLWVTAFLPEHTASALEVGSVARVAFRAPPTSVSAHLVRMGDFVDPASRSVEARFELDSVPAGVRPGSFATVDVASGVPVEGVELDEEAAVRLGDRDVVFLVEGPGLYRPVEVTVLPMGEGVIAVQGLPEGAEIVTRGAYFLKAAMDLGVEGQSGADP